MARIVITIPNAMVPLIGEAFWYLYGDGTVADGPTKKALFYTTIRKMIAEQVSKYVQERDASSAISLAQQANMDFVELANTSMVVTEEADPVP